MVVKLTKSDQRRLQELTKHANTNPLAFREDARQSAVNYPRALRRQIKRLSTKDTSAYQLFDAWETNLAPKQDELIAVRQKAPLRNALAKYLQLSTAASTARAEHLVDERLDERLDDFLGVHYGLSGRARTAAAHLLQQPTDTIIDTKQRFVDYYLYHLVANEKGFAIYDAEALKRHTRRRTKRQERRQITRYRKAQAKRLAECNERMTEISHFHHGVISRIFQVNLEVVTALDAYRTYKKRLDALKPASRTPAKTLSLFTAVTTPLRESHAKTLTIPKKLADLQFAQQEFDSVLVEIFDMSDVERNSLMKQLKEYRQLSREANTITAEQTDFPL